MDNLVINRKITIKALVTEGFKKQLTFELQEGMNKLDAELKFIEQRAKKIITELTLKASPQVASIKEQLEYERQKREEARKTMVEQMKAVEALENGKEVIQEQIEGPVEVKVGDNWVDLLSREIVLEDGKIVAIR